MDLEKMETFNAISGDLEYTHFITGTEYDHEGNLIFVDTPWALGVVNEKGVTIG